MCASSVVFPTLPFFLFLSKGNIQVTNVWVCGRFSSFLTLTCNFAKNLNYRQSSTYDCLTLMVQIYGSLGKSELWPIFILKTLHPQPPNGHMILICVFDNWLASWQVAASCSHGVVICYLFLPISSKKHPMGKLDFLITTVIYLTSIIKK